MDTSPLRVVIRVHVKDIPSEPNARVCCLGDQFSRQVLSRELNHDLKAECHDAEHYLPNFDSENDIKA